MRTKFASATCTNCNTDFDRIPVDYCEDGQGYVAIPVQKCAHPTCDVLLCPCCPQVHTDCCGETVCADHAVSVEDGTDRPLHFCPTCAAEWNQQELDLVPEVAAHACIEHLSPLAAAAVESHGLESGPFEHTEETRWSCGECGQIYTEAEADLLYRQALKRPAAGELRIAAAMQTA